MAFEAAQDIASLGLTASLLCPARPHYYCRLPDFNQPGLSFIAQPVLDLQGRFQNSTSRPILGTVIDVDSSS